MINAHYKPSEEIIQKIDKLVKKYLYDCEIGPAEWGIGRYDICMEIAKEAGIENPTKNDAIDFLPAFTYHADKIMDKYLSMKYEGKNHVITNKKQETE